MLLLFVTMKEMVYDRVMLENKTVLVTGSAGFIGSHLCERLLKEHPGIRILGVDDLNDYYDVSLKLDRNEKLKKHADYTFIKGDLSEKGFLEGLFETYHFDLVVNLAAQAGVRYSIENPDVYIRSNLLGFFNLLEAIRNHPVEHFLYASSSSVYGGNTKVPFSTEDKTDHPVSLYAATKKADELMAYTYTHLFGMKTTGLRFFTVYGPAGRPDMAYFSFTKKLLKGEKIRIFNYGNCQRDFTYIDDITEGIVRIMEKGPKEDYNLYNIGNSHPENLMDFVYALGNSLKKYGLLPADFDIDSHLELVEMQAGDVPVTYADVSALEEDYDFHPDTPLSEGLDRFAEWYKKYYG